MKTTWSSFGSYQSHYCPRHQTRDWSRRPSHHCFWRESWQMYKQYIHQSLILGFFDQFHPIRHIWLFFPCEVGTIWKANFKRFSRPLDRSHRRNELVWNPIQRNFGVRVRNLLESQISFATRLYYVCRFPSSRPYLHMYIYTLTSIPSIASVGLYLPFLQIFLWAL
jgi:hypothetical protein